MRTTFIIGASSGIGKQIAEDLHEKGEQVIGTRYQSQPADMPYALHSLNVLEDTLNLDFLPDTLDAFVYCPGSITLKPVARITPQDYILDYQLQVVGAIKIIQAILPRLRKGQNPSILLFSTVAVQQGFPFHTMVSSSKGAVEGFTRALAAELAPTIRVNCIAPSITDTKLAKTLLNSDDKIAANANRHPLKKIGSPKDISEAATFLLSQRSGWITGQVIAVDGGMSSLKV